MNRLFILPANTSRVLAPASAWTGDGIARGLGAAGMGSAVDPILQ
jgi:hypothetical protein